MSYTDPQATVHAVVGMGSVSAQHWTDDTLAKVEAAKAQCAQLLKDKEHHGERVQASMALLSNTRRTVEEVNTRIGARMESANQTVADIKDTLKKWDVMKARWGEVLDGFARHVAEGLQENRPPVGPPTGETAHGFDAPPGLDDPPCVVTCPVVARPKMDCGLLAHEYHDTPTALAAKVKMLASMLRRATHTCIYTGAGISTAAGIRDYATQAKQSSVVPRSTPFGDATPFDAGSAINAEPTYAHRAVVALHSKGLVHGDWINQNHDGLPEKAGMPQHKVSEIHGSWFDPTNPVVPMAGKLREDLHRRLQATMREADLVIAMGTSLSGVSADSVVSGIGNCRRRQAEAASDLERARLSAVEERAVLGAVIINVQQTRLDRCCALRIFASCDEVMTMLCAELGVTVAKMPSALKPPPRDVWTDLPYDATTGEKLACSSPPSSLDMAAGRRVQLADSNEGVPGELRVGLIGTVGPRTKHGAYQIDFSNGTRAYIGGWVLESAKMGYLQKLPLVAAPPPEKK